MQQNASPGCERLCSADQDQLIGQPPALHRITKPAGSYNFEDTSHTVGSGHEKANCF